jgi:hypothetical protein
VPRGRSPYRDWNAAAIDAYKIDGLDHGLAALPA